MHTSSSNLIRAISYLRQVIDLRLSHYFKEDSVEEPHLTIPDFELTEADDVFTRFLLFAECSVEEFITLICSLVPHLVPNFFEQCVAPHLKEDGHFPEFGGYKGKNGRYLLPTINTVLFILAGEDLEKRMQLMGIFEEDHLFFREQVLHIEAAERGTPLICQQLFLDEEYVELFTQGYVSLPKLSTRFPAEQLATEMEWEDLVLTPATRRQLNEIELWLKHNEAVMQEWGLGKKVKPGYRALFYGPPGTGKTLAATLIGKASEKPVFRVDLSKVVSKYIGETEKNLANLFDKAEHKDWILFFDEADACFGKRSSTKDAKDRYANQEIAYLLQRIEAFNGLVILATNFKNNIDEAFLRRLNASVYFPKPKVEERLQLWQKAIPSQIQLAAGIDLNRIAEEYDLTGSHIVGAIHFACLKTKEANAEEILEDFITQGIRRELAKEGKRV